jgi:hypothetical protein
VPVTLFAALLLAALLVVYAVVVSVLRIKPLNRRQRGARIASLILGLAVLASLIELHTVLLRLAFETVEHIKPQAEVPATGAKFFEFVFVWLKNIALVSRKHRSAIKQQNRSHASTVRDAVSVAVVDTIK